MSGPHEGAGTGVQGPNPARLLGRVLDGRFELTSILGVGGMGTVYRAEQQRVRDGRPVTYRDPRVRR